jgi:hypothetical protein
MTKKIFKEIFIIIGAFILAIPIIAFLFRLDENQNMKITIFGTTSSMSIKLAQIHIWLILIFIIYSFRQITLKFKNLISNLILIATCLILIYIFKVHLNINENLQTAIQNDQDANNIGKEIQKVNSLLIFNWSLIITFAIIGMLTLYKSIKEIKNVYKK